MLKKLLFSTLLFLLLNSPSHAFTGRNLTIFAEPNLAIALTKISRLYSQQHNIVLALNFASSIDLVEEIDGGEPADIFISAHSDLIENLRHKGIVDVYNIGYFAEDDLVLIIAKNSKSNFISTEKNLNLEVAIAILNKNRANIIIDTEGSSSGKFSDSFIKKHGFNDLKVFQRLNEDKNLITNLVSGTDQYALLLRTQVNDKKELKILAVKKDENIFYQALVIAGDNMENAREFLKFLKSAKAKEILRANGFRVN